MHKVGQLSKMLVVVPKNQLQILNSSEAAALTVPFVGSQYLYYIPHVQAVRFQSTQPSAAAIERQKKKEKAMSKKAVHSKSFCQNIFRGIVEPEQVFPYPIALDEEQRENLEMLVPIAERVMTEQNDPLLNDQLESVPEPTIQALRELGAFGLQVRLI